MLGTTHSHKKVALKKLMKCTPGHQSSVRPQHTHRVLLLRHLHQRRRHAHAHVGWNGRANLTCSGTLP